MYSFEEKLKEIEAALEEMKMFKGGMGIAFLELVMFATVFFIGLGMTILAGIASQFSKPKTT